MDKIFLQKLSNMLDLASDMNKFGNHFIIDVDCKNHTVKDLNTFAHRIKQISNNVNDATKFFLTNNVMNFVADNFVDILKMDKMKQEFRLPTDKPLLIQLSDLNRTILINEIDGFAYADYQVDFFTNYKDSKQILINPYMSFVFSKNFFIELLDKFPEIYLNFHKQDYADLVETTKEWRENRMGQIFQLLMIYFSVINLSNDLDIFEEKSKKLVFCIVSNVDFPNIKVKFVKGKETKENTADIVLIYGGTKEDVFNALKTGNIESQDVDSMAKIKGEDIKVIDTTKLSPLFNQIIICRSFVIVCYFCT